MSLSRSILRRGETGCRFILNEAREADTEATIIRHLRILRPYKAGVDPGPNHDKYIYVYIY